MLEKIQNGEFARKWIAENKAGRPEFNASRRKEQRQLIEEVGSRLRANMKFLDPVTAPDLDATAPEQSPVVAAVGAK
jgi:ketol-acid reductoisomerase